MPDLSSYFSRALGGSQLLVYAVSRLGPSPDIRAITREAQRISLFLGESAHAFCILRWAAELGWVAEGRRLDSRLICFDLTDAGAQWLDDITDA
jgi:hypothetical protein